MVEQARCLMTEENIPKFLWVEAELTEAEENEILSSKWTETHEVITYIFPTKGLFYYKKEERGNYLQRRQVAYFLDTQKLQKVLQRLYKSK